MVLWLDWRSFFCCVVGAIGAKLANGLCIEVGVVLLVQLVIFIEMIWGTLDGFADCGWADWVVRGLVDKLRKAGNAQR